MIGIQKLKVPEEDIQALKLLFKKLCFDTKVFSFDGGPMMYQYFEFFNFSEYNTFFLVVLSDEQEGFKCSMSYSDRGSILADKCCESLAKNLTLIGRPKILIFESSFASGRRQETVSLEKLQGSAKFFTEVVFANMISKNSTSSPRSDFIQALCQQVDVSCDDDDVVTLMGRLSDQFPGQMIILSTLRKKLSLWRGNIFNMSRLLLSAFWYAHQILVDLAAGLSLTRERKQIITPELAAYVNVLVVTDLGYLESIWRNRSLLNNLLSIT